MRHIRYKFREKKATQVAARFLKLSGGRENYTKLIKLLYLLDRTALANWGVPSTWDKLVSMPHGPVVSNIYDFITTQPRQEEPHFWHQHISTQGYDVQLDMDPGDGELSEAEFELIEQIWNAHRDRDFGGMIDFCHDKKNVPEWDDPQGSSANIWPDRILEFSGWSLEDIETSAGELEYFGNKDESLDCAS